VTFAPTHAEKRGPSPKYVFHVNSQEVCLSTHGIWFWNSQEQTWIGYQHVSYWLVCCQGPSLKCQRDMSPTVLEWLLASWEETLLSGVTHVQWPRFSPRSGHMEFVVDKVELAQVFSEYFSFPYQFSLNWICYTHLLSGAGTLGPLRAGVPSGLTLTPPHKLKEITCVHTLVMQYFCNGLIHIDK
jgi:hypothetical protein